MPLELLYTLESIDDAAARFWDALGSYRLFAFNGEMGAGKTTFIHKICDHLHVQDVVSSPTFALINEYHFDGMDGMDNIIYHLDWYRLKNTEEAINAGMEDCIAQAREGIAFCFIEWPQKAVELITGTYVNIQIESLSLTTRKMTAEIVK